MPSIQITSNNYNGQIAQITFYSVNAPTTAINLGRQTIPYSRSSNDIYGIYQLNFIVYNKTCTVSLNDPTTTAPPTTTPAPGTTGFIVQAVMNGSDDQYGGTYCEDGTYTYDGITKPKYRKAGTDYYIYWLSAYGMNVWAINNYGSLGTFASVFVDSNASTPPTTGWYDYDNSGAPTITQTTCATTTTTTTTTPAPTTTTTTTTTTTAAPMNKLTISRLVTGANTSTDTSSFSGNGTSSTPYSRTTFYNFDVDNQLWYYQFTATSDGTFYWKASAEDDDNGDTFYVKRTRGGSTTTIASYSGSGSRSIGGISGIDGTYGTTTMLSGDIFEFVADIPSQDSFGFVSIYAT